VPRFRLFILACLAPLLAVSVAAQGRSAHAQEPVRGWELPWLDISPNGGWRVRARAVAAERARLLSQRRYSALNAPAALGAVSATALTGILHVPVILFRFRDSPATQYSRDTAQYNATLFGVVPPNGKPYTLRTFYEEMSNGLFSIQGRSVGWVALDSNEATYTGAPGTCPGNPYGTKNCNGVWSDAATAAMQRGLREALAKADSQVDFSQYDDNGDGVVDAVLFVHPSMDGACVSASNNHLWSHRFTLFYATNDTEPGGRQVVVSDYILQSGLGSPGGGVCDSTAIMPIGTAAHELGHILALPDLYDVSGATDGIGEWGLMGSGNYAKPESPARYDAWSLQQMGWTTIVPLTIGGIYALGPEPTADSIFTVDVQGANPRNEFFLLENRQAVQSDSAMIRVHCQRSGNPAGCGGGLLLWHVDGTKACMMNVCGGNTVNAGTIHGVALEEADGLRQLWGQNVGNRGDAGDPYPGTSENPALSFSTNPAAVKNEDGSFVGFAVDSIRQLTPGGAMAFRLRFGGLTVVEGSDTSAVIQVDGMPYTVYRDLFADGSSHSVAVADTQFTRGGRSRLVFQAWSDSGAIAHTVTGSATGATYTALVAGAHLVTVEVLGNGSVTYDPPSDSSGTMVPGGTALTLVAVPTAPAVFGGWYADTTATTDTLVLPMEHPYALSVRFDPPLAVTSSDPRPRGIMGKAYFDTLRASGGTGLYKWVAQEKPLWLKVDATGLVTGTPDQTGTWTYVVRATSGAQQVVQQLSITVTAPNLSLDQVMAQLLTGTSTLSPDDVNYLDLLGNHSGLFDVGDFLAWVRATGATPTALRRSVRAGGRQ
jgi:M6 family metalloprotease-like protein